MMSKLWWLMPIVYIVGVLTFIGFVITGAYMLKESHCGISIAVLISGIVNFLWFISLSVPTEKEMEGY